VKPLVVLSLEQALSLPYATSRMVQRGWRVIRIESPAGDPNRKIGAPIGGPDRCAYFVGPNVGKQSVCLDLHTEAGRADLHAIVQGLQVDVFCCNTLPGRYARLGIDPETLRTVRPGLIWAGISAYGPGQPDTPGYDPALQAELGWMDLTGPADGSPTLCGLPVVDLKAGDELFTQVALALAERGATGQGATLHVSMARAAASWLVTTLPLLDTGAPAGELTRAGSEHRQFVPSNAYPTIDGFAYLAIGSDRQWAALVAQPAFVELDRPEWTHNGGRKAGRVALHAAVADCTRRRTTAENLAIFQGAGLVCAAIRTVAQAAALPWLAPLLRTTQTPTGDVIRLPPLACGDDARRQVAFAPKLGEHTAAVIAEARARLP